MPTSLPIPKHLIEQCVHRALEEDVGPGDLTTSAIVPANQCGEAVVQAKADGVAAGVPIAITVFRAVDADSDVAVEVEDGDAIRSGQTLIQVSGRVASLLTAERVALNFLQQLSGVATVTRRFVDAVAGTDAAIVDTRKTAPGLRMLQKYAVRAGGGRNHRLGLYDAVLIKENHIAACGSVTEAVARARSSCGHTVTVEAECQNLAEVEEAVSAGVDAILLDNMSIETMEAAVQLVSGRAMLEASGNISLDNVRQVAETGVDVISVGALTHSAPALDMTMLLTNGGTCADAESV